MKLLTSIFRELLGLFVDDGSLALQLVVLIALVAAAVRLVGLNPLIGALMLVVGCIVVLGASLARATRR